jgi:hypothetical protein
MFKQRKGQATRYAHLWGAHPYQCYKRRAEHTCEVYILINVFAGDDNSRTRESVSILVYAQARRGAYVVCVQINAGVVEDSLNTRERVP